LACLYLPTGVVKHEDQLIAEAVGLAGQEVIVRQLLATGAPVGVALLQQMVAGLGLTSDAIESLSAYAERPLRAFYSEAVCGGAVLRLQDSAAADGAPAVSTGAPTIAPRADRPNDRGAAVPMAFQSAMSGILLAAALVADAADLQAPEGSKVVLDLLRPLGNHLTVPVGPHPSGRCLCQDSDYRAAYSATWGSPSRILRAEDQPQLSHD
jgi:hypothetical protein